MLSTFNYHTSDPELERVLSQILPKSSRPFTSSLPLLKKRAYVDLTLDDDDDDDNDNNKNEVPRKRSRSSSHSTTSRLGISKPESASETDDHPVAGKTQVSSPKFKGTIAAAVVVPAPASIPAPEVSRRRFLQNLSALGSGVSLYNDLDGSSPPTTFKFVKESLLGLGVSRATEDFMSGCKCRKDNGRNIGCEYLSCECLADSADSEERKKVFPYSAAKGDFGCLRNFYLQNRHHIYECNSLCNCDSNCKNRVVQHGRTVALQIFKTPNRGWGLRCMQDLKKGQFIDTYRGEIITNEEANRRSKTRTLERDIYLMDLDKWTEEDGAAQYVCDGMHVGGPTRFINHSCDPNCAIYTVSYNHADISIYELAFFATEAIPKGTELTFDYVGEEDHSRITEKRANELEKEKGYRPAKCLCGTQVCRGYFFN